MGWQSDVAAGYAQRLNDAGLGVYAPTIASGQPGAGAIYRGQLPADVLGYGIQTYRVGPDDPQNPTTQLRIQFWLRAATIGDLDDMDSGLYDTIQGLHGVAMGVAMVTDTQSYSSVPQGVDGNGNLERACNYTVDLDLPATALRSN